MSRYTPTCATPHPPFDVSLPIGAAIVSTAAVIAHLAASHAWQAALILALAVGLAGALRRRWRRAVAEDPGRDLFVLLFLPAWGVAVVLLACTFTAVLLESKSLAGPIGAFVLLSVGSALPSGWFASWLSAAAARGGPLALGTRARELVRLGVWRTAAVALWPVQFFGVFDTMSSRHGSVAALVTAACWITVAGIAFVQLRSRHRTAAPPPAAPAELEERDYRSLQERPPEPPPPGEPETVEDLARAIAPELRADLWALLAISVPLGLHALLIFG